MTWKKGESGNINGKPKGLLGKKTIARMELESIQTMLRSSLDKDAKDILAAMIDSAKTGNVVAGRALLDRLLPPSAPVVPFALTGTPAEQADQITAALAAGRMVASDAKALLEAVAVAANIRNATDTATRLESLERTISELTGTTNAK